MNNVAYGEYKEFPPRYVYKYFTNLNFAFDVIKNDRIHLENPAKYNDIFDNAISISEKQLNLISFDETTLENISFFIHRDYKNTIKALSKSQFKECTTLNDAFEIISKHIPKEIAENCKSLIATQFNNIKPANNKVSCFSELKDSVLMWAHYANHLRGVCLVFDTTLDQKLFSNMHKVNYSKFRNHTYVNYNFCFEKSLEWSYEQEWRIVSAQDDEYISTKSCVGVIYGFKSTFFPEELFEKEKHEFSNITVGKITLEAYQKGLNVYKAIPDKQEYKINITPIQEWK